MTPIRRFSSATPLIVGAPPRAAPGKPADAAKVTPPPATDPSRAAAAFGSPHGPPAAYGSPPFVALPGRQGAGQVVGGVDDGPAQPRGQVVAGQQLRGELPGGRVDRVAGEGEPARPARPSSRVRSRAAAGMLDEVPRARTPAVSSACSGCQKPSAVASTSRLESSVPRTMISQAAAFAAGSGRAARHRAARCSPVALRSARASASISRLAGGAEHHQPAQQQPAQLGVDRQPGRHLAPGQPAGGQLRRRWPRRSAPARRRAGSSPPGSAAERAAAGRPRRRSCPAPRAAPARQVAVDQGPGQREHVLDDDHLASRRAGRRRSAPPGRRPAARRR